MGECSCWSVGAWTSLAMGVVSTGLLVAAMVRLGMARRQLLRLARERDAAREALLDATIRREVAEAERREAPEPLEAGPLDIRALAEAEVRRAARYGRALSMILLRLPHACAPDDPLWSHLSSLLRDQLRDSDHAGRLDGASTLIVLSETSPAVADEVARRLAIELQHDRQVAQGRVRYAVDTLTGSDASAETILGRLTRTVDALSEPVDVPPA